MSRLSLARRAVRPQSPARVLISGPAGAGPLMVGLDLAERIADRVVVIDSADGACLDLADLHTFDVVHWRAPFASPELVAALADVAPGEAVVIDHFTAWWGGAGGLRDLGHTRGWEEARGLLGNLVRAILQCRGHVLATARCRLRTSIELVDGREHARTVAEGPSLDEQLIYPWPLSLRVTSGLDVDVDTSRVPTITPGPVLLDLLADELTAWRNTGAPIADPAYTAALVDEMDLPDAKARRALKTDFSASFGPPSMLPASQLEAAQAFIDKHKETP